MNALLLFLSQHPLIWPVIQFGLQNIFSAAVYSLPEPPPLSSLWYQFLFKFANKLAGNYSLKGK